VQAARTQWQDSQSELVASKLVFLDETGASTHMARRFGRCRKGERLICKQPWGHWKTVTLTAALRSSGLTAPMLLDGPMDGQAFRAYIERFLAPTLKPGDIVILDNLQSHKVAGVQQAIEATGAKLIFLPPYSPDLNPIELAFAKLKALLRKAAARTITGLHKAIARIVKTISPQECANYFAKAGYAN